MNWKRSTNHVTALQVRLTAGPAARERDNVKRNALVTVVYKLRHSVLLAQIN